MFALRQSSNTTPNSKVEDTRIALGNNVYGAPKNGENVVFVCEGRNMNYLSLLLPLCLLNLLAAENQNPERRIVHPRALSGSP